LIGIIIIVVVETWYYYDMLFYFIFYFFTLWKKPAYLYIYQAKSIKFQYQGIKGKEEKKKKKKKKKKDLAQINKKIAVW